MRLARRHNRQNGFAYGMPGAAVPYMSDSSSLVEYDQWHAKGGYGPPLISTVLYNRPARSKKIDYDVVRESRGLSI